MKKILVYLILLTVSGLACGQKTNKLFTEKEIKKRMIKAATWQLDNPGHDLSEHYLTDWTNGAFYAGLFAAYETTGSHKLYKAIYEMGESNKWKTGGRVHHADDHMIAQTYIDMFRLTGEEKMLQAYKHTVEKFINTHYSETPGVAGGVEAAGGTLLFWCDALFMLPPTLVKLGCTINEDKYLTLSDSLFKQTYDLLFDVEEHLYARDIGYKWDHPGMESRKEANGEKVFWSRGNGWVMGGLARILQELPKENENRGFYVQNFKEMAQKIKELQQPDGLWRSSLLDPDNYPGGEASGSGFYCYAMAWAINNGILNREEYLPAVQKTWVGLCGLQHKNGMIGWVQPIGADPKKNFSTASWEVYGTGAFLLAGSEVVKL